MRSTPMLVLLLLCTLSAEGPVRAGEESVPARHERLRARFGEKAAPAWWLGRAETAARTIEHPDGKAASLVSVASGWLTAGDPVAARRALGEAYAFARVCEGCHAKVQRLADVGVLQHEAGDDEAARATLDAAAQAARGLEAGFRPGSLAIVGGARGAIGDLEGAQALLAEAEEAAGNLRGRDRVDALSEVATAQGIAGNFERADRILQMLRGEVPRRGQGAPTGRVDVEAALVQVETLLVDLAASGGDAEEARRRVPRIVDPVARTLAWLAVAEAVDEPGTARAAILSARGAASEVAESLARALLRADIAGTAGRLGIGDLAATELASAMAGAAASFDDLGYGPGRLEVLLRLAVAWHAVGDADQPSKLLSTARAEIDAHMPLREVGEAYEALAVAASDADRLGIAAVAAASIEQPEGQARAWVSIGEAAHRRGHAAALADATRRLQALLASWPDALARPRDEALRGLAFLQALREDLDGAAATVDRIQRPFHRVAGFTYVARTLSGHAGGAR